MRATWLLMAMFLLACRDDDAGSATTDAGTHHGGAGHDAAPAPEVDAGSDSGPAAAADAGGASDFGASDVCSECLDRECSAEATACHESAGCTALVECARGCSSADAGDC